MRALSTLLLCVISIAGPLGCPEAASEGEGEAEGEGEGEGETLSYRFERDGVALDADALALSDYDSASGPLDLQLTLKNTGGDDFTILSEPPLLVAGRNGSFFSVTTQPPALVPAQTAVPFTVRYAPNGGGEHEGKFLFAYGVRSDERALLTIEVSAQGGEGTPGVRTSIYDGGFEFLPDFSTLNASETFVQPSFDISARAGGDLVAFLFEGAVNVTAQGSHTFFTTSDDGSKLFIDGVLVVDNDGLHAAVEQSGAVELSPGNHAIRVEFFESAGGEVLLVEWQQPGSDKEQIPAERLFTN